MIDMSLSTFALAQAWLFEHLVQPALYALGLARYGELAFDGVEWFLIGVLEVIALWLVLAPLERWRPAQAIADQRQVLTDVIYTLVHRLGAFALIAFAFVQPLADDIEGALRYAGIDRFDLDALWPGVTDIAWVSFLLYLVLFDFVDYWLHRGQHTLHWWWQLHALHHSQRDMTFWADQRNHVLDDLIRDAVFALLAVAIGVPPEQFVALVVASRVLQSVQHANVRLHFGPFERVLVSPRFHRRHHAIGVGHEGASGSAKQWGVNFAVLFPVWDVLFRTADFSAGYPATGVRDQLPGQSPRFPTGRDYGRGFWSQQWIGLKRLLNRA
ncbi:MAG TPA: sterol desaturase family protein [Burkholderiaceae bacterium]|nr:sterol desaturase family protein [Burkholderiaceae bacterium]